MTTSLPPVALDLRALAQKADTLSGQAPLGAFERLAEGLEVPSDLPLVHWCVQAEWREAVQGLAAEVGRSAAPPQLWLHLQAQGQVPQTCQRCLAPCVETVAVDRWFRFAADEATAAAEDEDSEEDVLALEPRFDLLRLLEDELLMALPLVPMHTACPKPLPMVAGDLPEVEPDARPHPFAALAALKRGTGH